MLTYIARVSLSVSRELIVRAAIKPWLLIGAEK
jgi:hypothetical protein